MKLAFLISLMICATLISTRHGHRWHGKHHGHGPFHLPEGPRVFQMTRFRFGGNQNPADEFNNDIKDKSFEVEPTQTPFVHHFMHMFGRHHQPMLDRPHFAKPFNGAFFGPGKFFGRHGPRFERHMPGFGFHPFGRQRKINKIFKHMFKSFNKIVPELGNQIENDNVPAGKVVEIRKEISEVPNLNKLMIFRIVRNIEIPIPKSQDDGVDTESDNTTEEEIIEEPVEESTTEVEEEAIEDNSTDLPEEAPSTAVEEFSPVPALPGINPACLIIVLVVGKDAAAVLALIKQKAWIPLVFFAAKLVQDIRAGLDCIHKGSDEPVFGQALTYLKPHLEELKGVAKDILRKDYTKAQETIEKFVSKIQEIADSQ